MSDRFLLIFISIIFVIFCTILYFNVSPVKSHQDIDSSAYIVNAVRFYQTNSFADQNNPQNVPYYALGYAFFVGIIYKIFGINNFFVIWIQVLLALLTGFLIFKTAKILANKAIAILAFILFAFNVGFIVFSQFILTEILLAFLLTFFVYKFILFIKNNNFSDLIQAAFVLGISVTVKPAAIYFIFPLILLLLFFKNKFKSIILLLLFFYIPVVGYMFFNKITFNNFCVAPLGNENLYLYLLPKVLAEKNNTDERTEWKNVTLLLTGNKLSKQSWEKIHELFMQKFKKNPFIFIKLWLKNVGKTYVGLFTTNLKVLVEPTVRGGDVSFFKTKGNVFQRIWRYISAGTNSNVIKLIGLYESTWTIIRYFLCFVALLFLIVKRNWLIFFFLFFYLFYFSVITGHDGCARFRMMFEPVLIILAAFGIWIIWNYLVKKRKLKFMRGKRMFCDEET